MSMQTAYCTLKLQPVRAANGTFAQMPLRKGCSLSLGTGVTKEHRRRTNVGRHVRSHKTGADMGQEAQKGLHKDKQKDTGAGLKRSLGKGEERCFSEVFV